MIFCLITSLCEIRIVLNEKFQPKLDICLYKIAYHVMGKEMLSLRDKQTVIIIVVVLCNAFYWVLLMP